MTGTVKKHVNANPCLIAHFVASFRCPFVDKTNLNVTMAEEDFYYKIVDDFDSYAPGVFDEAIINITRSKHYIDSSSAPENPSLHVIVHFTHSKMLLNTGYRCMELSITKKESSALIEAGMASMRAAVFPFERKTNNRADCISVSIIKFDGNNLYDKHSVAIDVCKERGSL